VPVRLIIMFDIVLLFPLKLPVKVTLLLVPIGTNPAPLFQTDVSEQSMLLISI
jgi:hypothetical protein